jgi:hypothetical protein
MKILVVSAFALMTATSLAFAQSPPAAVQSDPRPSEDSIRQLLEITQAKKILQAASDQLDTLFDGMVKKQLEGENVTSEQQQAIEARRKAAESMVKDLLSWESMERLYLKVYEETFTQSEIDGMIAFYSTSTGRAVIAKLPLATKNTMSEMQQRMQQMIPKLQQMAKETAEQVKAQGGAKKTG